MNKEYIHYKMKQNESNIMRDWEDREADKERAEYQEEQKRLETKEVTIGDIEDIKYYIASAYNNFLNLKSLDDPFERVTPNLKMALERITAL